MAEKKKNTTWQKIKNSPFSSAKELKEHEDKIDREEWERITRAESRLGYFQRPESRIGRLLSQGYKASFKSQDDEGDHSVRVFLNEENEIEIEINNDLKSEDKNGTLEALVRSLSQSFVSGYLMSVGLRNDDPLNVGKKAKLSD